MTYRREEIAGLTVGLWGDPAERPVLAVHGITANHQSWKAIAERYDGGIIAPDLRGRGGSWQASGPAGMERHAEDLVAILDALEIDRAVIAGHSMGASAVSVFAHRHPDRVRKLVLVDGGIPFPPLPDDVDADEVMEAILGPALARLKLTWPDREAVHDFWKAHPALSDWNDYIEAYADYDVGDGDTDLRSRIAPELIREDGREMHLGQAAKDAWDALPGQPFPAVFLHAERGLLNEPPPLYPAPEEFENRIAVERLPGSNHYTILFQPQYAAAVAHALKTSALQNGAE